MSIKVNTGFLNQSATPLDSRQVVATLDDLLALDTNIIYNGLECYVTSLDCKYKYHEDYNEASTGHWKLNISEGGAGHIELTQAEYDALSDEEKLNGAIYFITDAEGGEGGDASIDDNNISSESTWSSAKIVTEISDNYAIFEGVVGDSYYSTVIDEEDIANVPTTDLYGDWTLDKVTTNLTEGSILSAFNNATKKKVLSLTEDVKIVEVYSDSFSVMDDTMNNGGKPYKVALLWGNEDGESEHEYEASIKVEFNSLYNTISHSNYKGKYQEMKEAYERGDKIKLLVEYKILGIDSDPDIVYNYDLDLAYINTDDSSFNFELTDRNNINCLITINSSNSSTVELFSLDRKLDINSERGVTNKAITTAINRTDTFYRASSGNTLLLYALTAQGINLLDAEKEYYLFDIEITDSTGGFAHAKAVLKYKTLSYLEVITENGITFTNIDNGGGITASTQGKAFYKVNYLGICASDVASTLTSGVSKDYVVSGYKPTIGRVSSVPNDEEASVSITIDEANQTSAFNFEIPVGRKGSQWYTGTIITNTSTSPMGFNNSDVAYAYVNDMYLNTDTGNVYKCTIEGNPSYARWVYVGSIKGAKGNPGDNGTTPTIKAAAGSNINTVGTPSVSASTSGTTTTFTFNNLKGAKGDPGTNGTTPTIKVAAGSNINSVGTPTVTASTSGTTTTFTFDYLKGATGAKGSSGVTKSTNGPNYTVCTLQTGQAAILFCIKDGGGYLKSSLADGSVYINGTAITSSNQQSTTIDVGKVYAVTNQSSSSSTTISTYSNGGGQFIVLGPV